MDVEIVYVGDHLFVDGVHGTLYTKGYFHCKHPNCPFALKMIVEVIEGKKRAVGLEKTVFTVHYHEEDDKPKETEMREISHDLILIQQNPMSDEAKAADARHKLGSAVLSPLQTTSSKR